LIQRIGSHCGRGPVGNKPGFHLPDIFLSYGHGDEATARRFAESFEREGFSVWWDASLRSGDAFDATIEAALRSAKAVVVLWSAISVQSRWVRAEATLAERNKTLMPVMIEHCDRPIMFELMHTADLSHWNGDPNDLAWQTYLSGLRRLVEAGGRSPDSTAENRQPITRDKDSASAISSEQRLPSIAVLPFANLSGDKEQEYFSDGLAEEIINALAKIPRLKVIARTSAFAFKGQNIDIRRIAETLGVASILEGSVRRSGNRIRVTAQLIAATDGTHLWSERYDRELADVFAVQDEISAAISKALQVRLSPQAAAKPRYTPKLPAYEALLKAQHFHWKVTAEAMGQARPFYEQAIALDPQFALAHALYADYLIGRAVVSLSPLREVASVIRSLAHRALELDASLADAHAPLCILAALHDYDWKEARHQFALATPGGQGSPQARMECGWACLLASGQRQEAVEQLRLAVQGDPLHLTHRSLLALCLGAAGHFTEAEELLRQARDLDPNFFLTHYHLAGIYTARQMFAEALACAEKAFSLAPWYRATIGMYAGLLVRMGQPDRGQDVFKALGSSEAYGTARAVAVFHTCCGQIDLAAVWFERAIEERDPSAPALLQSAIGEPLRLSPRWPKLAALMNLSDAVGTLAT
jgi:TolB-like protein/tetratricopeptide (TPR) repeat protein